MPLVKGVPITCNWNLCEGWSWTSSSWCSGLCISKSLIFCSQCSYFVRFSVAYAIFLAFFFFPQLNHHFTLFFLSSFIYITSSIPLLLTFFSPTLTSFVHFGFLSRLTSVQQIPLYQTIFPSLTYNTTSKILAVSKPLG